MTIEEIKNAIPAMTDDEIEQLATLVEAERDARDDDEEVGDDQESVAMAEGRLNRAIERHQQRHRCSRAQAVGVLREKKPALFSAIVKARERATRRS